MSKPSRRFKKLDRRHPQREPKRRILVICEGKVTEPLYFKSLARELRNSIVEIEIDNQGGVPKTLVERASVRKREAELEAKRQRDEFLRYDMIWCVFDVDEHPHLSDARQQARANGIDLAVSNPCFELWALLHFQDHTGHLTRAQARKQLKRHLPAYDKTLPFNRLHPTYLDAVSRAKNLDQRREDAQDAGGNPSTGVYQLTEHIREGSK